MPESPPLMRRRKARIAYESGAKRSNFGRRRGDARPRRQPVRDAAAAERSPERRAPDSERHRRPSGAPSPAAGIHALADVHASPIRSDSLADARSPARRKFVRKVPTRLADSCSGRPGTTPFSLEIAPLRPTDPQRTAPQRPKAPTAARAAAALKGVEDQNKSGDCRARARPLMSSGGTVARGGAQPRATGGQPPLVGR